MTDDAKRIVEALRHVGTSLTNDTLNCSACPMQEIPVEELDCGSKCPETLMHLAADLIEHLDEENAGLDMLLTSAQSAAETWQRRAEAAERDLSEADRLDCVHCIHNKPIDAKCEAHDCNCRACKEPCACKSCEGNSNWKWRGPCAENGGDDHAK